MPVLLEIINQPDAADMADLEKIYADYPLPPVASLADWLFDQREAGKTLVSGRFNGHLLGALWLGQDGQIEHLCVRALTRRRGTARQLLQLLQRHAEQMRVQQLRVTNGAALAPLWQQLGFVEQGAEWIWRR
jgi:ribosomal protein S18 acetylase RimI-like enzyme